MSENVFGHIDRAIGQIEDLMSRHIESCHQHILPCSRTEDGKHDWNMGWPGNFCKACGIDDPGELCLADDCRCPCHDEIWRQYWLLGCPDGCLAVKEDEEILISSPVV